MKLSRAVWLFTVVVVMFSGSVAAQEKTLRIGMSVANIPRTTGQPDQGFEGIRFAAIPLSDSLTQWDLSRADKPSPLIPGLALSWKVDEQDRRKWIFKLRQGVRFHDGSVFNAAAVVWNVEKILNKSSPQYEPDNARVATMMPSLRSARRIDDYTVELTSVEPDSFLPFNLTNLFMASPAQWERKYAALPASMEPTERTRQAWLAFARDASGTGPFKMTALVSLTLAEGLRIAGFGKFKDNSFNVRERLDLARNGDYWDPKRRPRIEKLAIYPIPEGDARIAALLAGQVDWIEAPPLNELGLLRQKGFNIYANSQPHVWPWLLSFAKESPWRDLRTRQAANLCVNREALKQQLGGMMDVATGMVESGHPWRGNPQFRIRYDPDEARRLMSQAFYSETRPMQVKVQMAAFGSGQMMPVLMNEIIKQNLKACYFDVQFEYIEWNHLNNNVRAGARDASAHGANALNFSFASMDPYLGLARFVDSRAVAPTSQNWGGYSNSAIDELLARARNTFDTGRRDAILAQLHAALVDDAPLLWVAHDVGTRVMSPRVKGVVQPHSWFIDIATMTMD